MDYQQLTELIIFFYGFNTFKLKLLHSVMKTNQKQYK